MASGTIGRIAAGLAAGILGVLLASGATASAEVRYTDLGGAAWAADSIAYLTDRGTIAGYGGGIFKPHAEVTRGQAVTFLMRELSENARTAQAGSDAAAQRQLPYKDVPTAHPFHYEIMEASRLGLAAGYDDGRFRPDAPVSRAETMALLSRAYAMEAGDQAARFPDAEAHWAADPIRIMGSNGLIGGYADGSFRPNRTVTRAEYAAFLTRVIRFERAAAIRAEDWDRLLSYMTLSEKVGQLLMPDIRQWQGKPTTEVHAGLRQTIREQRLGGLILFDKNITDARQLTTFTHGLQQAAGDIPLFLGIDQEGGVVKRIPGGTNLPGQMALGATRDTALAKAAGRLTGDELKALGVQVNFAPVLDINSNPDNPIIGIRSYGSDPEWVARLGLAAMQGMKEAGVVPAVKHFPGHGDTTVDSHLGLPILPHGRDRLDAVELKPFRSAIDDGADMIMTAHVAFPAIDDGRLTSALDGSRMPIPATLSRPVVTGLLRETLGFEGVVISDAFTMDAIRAHVGEERAVTMAVLAGVDMILMPEEPANAHRILVDAVEDGTWSEQALDDAVRRILKLKAKYGLFRPSGTLAAKLAETDRVVGSEQHRQLERRIAESAVTLLASPDGAERKAPAIIQPGDRVLVAAEGRELAEQVKRQLAAAHDGRIDAAALGESGTSALLREADYVILASYQFRSQASRHDWTDAQALVDAANGRQVPYTVLSLGNPYELLHLSNVKSAIAVYGKQEPNVAAGVKALLGRLSAQGTLPVS